jgi:hypothetical protein
VKTFPVLKCWIFSIEGCSGGTSWGLNVLHKDIYAIFDQKNDFYSTCKTKIFLSSKQIGSGPKLDLVADRKGRKESLSYEKRKPCPMERRGSKPCLKQGRGKKPRLGKSEGGNPVMSELKARWDDLENRGNKV